MTVLGENVLGEGNNTPPRKKFRLSLKTPGSQENRYTNVGLVRRNPFILYHGQHSVLPLRNSNCDYNYIQEESFKEKSESEMMLNGYLPGDSKGSPDDSDASCNSPVATLSNLGNTCFLNSVLYTLRFAPSFLHNLHHLALDLQQHSSSLKVKSSSLGRNMGLGGFGGTSSGKSWSSKDLPSLGGGAGGSATLCSSSAASAVFGNGPLDYRSRIRAVTERLHELYCSMRQAEQRESMEPFQPDIFLQSLRDVNPIFEGNQQHDAHELLVCLLDTIRETCRLMALIPRPSPPPAPPQAVLQSPQPPPSSKLSWGVRKSWKKKKLQQQLLTQQNKAPLGAASSVRASAVSPVPEGLGAEAVNGVNSLAGISECVDGEGCESSCDTTTEDAASAGTSHQCADLKQRSVPGYDFVADDFEGITVLRTTCLECETVTERKEKFGDICVPIATEEDSDDESCPETSDVYQSAVVTSEYLRDSNKYWCEQCLRYNEARRQVRYERLPRLMVLQLKRFSSTFGSMVCVSKVNDYMPTPLAIGCFCQTCVSEEVRPHSYRLFGVIMHLGATIASGHYVAYVRAADQSPDYRRCDRRRAASLDGALSGSGSAVSANSSGSSSSSGGDKMGSILKFFRPRSSASVTSVSGAAGHGAMVGDSNSAGGPCRGSDCCGIRMQLPAPSADATAVPDTPWLECDDETVRVLSQKEFEDVLGPKQSKTSSLTPYLLFYVRV